MTIPPYLIFLLIALLVVIVAGRFLSALIGVIAVTVVLVLAGLFIADLLQGGTALQQVADKLVPIVMAGIVAFIAWLKRLEGGR